jgi:hypothetical protein
MVSLSPLSALLEQAERAKTEIDEHAMPHRARADKLSNIVQGLPIEALRASNFLMATRLRGYSTRSSVA